MDRIFINLKRFDVPKSYGGICPEDDPAAWIRSVIGQCIDLGLGRKADLQLSFLLPEALILVAREKLSQYPAEATKSLEIGCQGVFREDVRPGGNFGAFTTNLPASAAVNLGCSWSIIGHSEERKDKLDLLHRFEPDLGTNSQMAARAKNAVDEVINAEVLRALERGLNVLLCIGETAAERGEGSFAEQQPRIERVLRSQLVAGLKGAADSKNDREIVIGYEPVWAIGPGKTPPGKEYIGYVSSFIKRVCREELGLEPPVVYGGGLKKENAAMIGSIPSTDGGLVALTRFTGDIGFEPAGLAEIVAEYQSASKE